MALKSRFRTSADYLGRTEMRKTLIAGLTLAVLVAGSSAASAQSNAAEGAAGGAAAGAITGAIVGGPVGAAIGAGVGGAVGGAAGDANDRNRGEVIVEERRAPAVTERTCVEGATSTECVERRR
jgi:phage tail tape-measure protein